MNTEITQSQELNEAPDRAKIIEWMNGQIEFKEIQLKLQQLDTSIAVTKAEYMKAMYTIAQISNPQQNSPSPELAKHTLTEEDLKANPDLVEQGFKAGDVVGIPKEAVMQEEAPAPAKKRTLKK
jgi:hypothetical protein